MAKTTESVSRGGEMALAITGGIFGILGGLFAVAVGGAQTAVEDQSMNVGGLGWAAIGFSVLAIVAAFYARSKPKVAGWLMVISAVGGLISISLFYILPFILIIVAGLMCLLRGRKSSNA